MGREEQIEEREVLNSIFTNEITDISDDSYRISIALDVAGQDSDSEPPAILLTVSYSQDYPDAPPELKITSSPNGPRCPYLTFPADSQQLLSTLTETISDCLGQAMIFTLISTLKENTEALISERHAAVEAEEDKERAKADAAENAKFHGEAVTRESFLRWRENFRKEQEKLEEERLRMEEERIGKKEMARGKDVKLTGKQLWEQGLVGKIEENEGEDGERDALSGVERFKVGE